MKKSSQTGFAHLGVALLLVVLAVVVFAGYKVVQNRNNSVTTASITTPLKAQTIPVIKNTADLNTVETTLDKQNIDGDLNPDSLNQDVQSLL